MIITIALVIAALTTCMWLITKLCDAVWFKALSPALIKRARKNRLVAAVKQRNGRKPNRDEWAIIEAELERIEK